MVEDGGPLRRIDRSGPMSRRLPTLRDLVLDRLTDEFGNAWQVGQDYHWSIERPSHPHINIAVDGWRTPGSVNVWLFDPHKTANAGGVNRYKVNDASEID